MGETRRNARHGQLWQILAKHGTESPGRIAELGHFGTPILTTGACAKPVHALPGGKAPRAP
jgi:hypothetical protein